VYTPPLSRPRRKPGPPPTFFSERETGSSALLHSAIPRRLKGFYGFSESKFRKTRIFLGEPPSLPPMVRFK